MYVVEPYGNFIYLRFLALSVVVDVDVRVLGAAATFVLSVAKAALTMNLAVASPRLVAVGANLTARIVLFGALGNANALRGIVLN